MPLPAATFADFSGGLNVNLPPWEIADNELAMAQDVFVAYDGFVRGRGLVEPADAADGSHTLQVTAGISPVEAHGIATAVTPDGKSRSLFGSNDSSGNALLNVWADDGTIALQHNYGGAATFPINSSFPIWCARPRLGGGVFISTADNMAIASHRHMLVWNGARKADYSTGTATFAQNSKTVTGVGTTWSTNVEPGMYFFSSNIYLGMVVTVNSDTSLTLNRAAPLSGTGAAYVLRSFRGINCLYSTGLITTFTDNTTVLGADTNFTDIGLQFFAWNLYRKSDGTFIGTVASVANDTGLTLTANAAVALTEEEFFAMRTDMANTDDMNSHTPYTAPGILTTIYKGHQFYADFAYVDLGFGQSCDVVSISEENSAERINLGPSTGSRIAFEDATVGGRKGIRGLEAAQGGVVVARDTETYAILGDTFDNFAPEKITDDGCLCPMSMVPWNGGVIWAGWDGVWFWAGGTPINVTRAKLGSSWQSMLSGFDPDVHRAWAFVHKDTYYIHIEYVNGPMYVARPAEQGAVPTFSTPNSVCYAIHMPTQTVTTMTGMFHHGAGIVPAAASGSLAPTAQQVVAVLQQAQPSNATAPFFADMMSFSGLHSGGIGVDAVSIVHRNTSGIWVDVNAFLQLNHSINGPLIYVETKHFSLGDVMRQKVWRGLLTTYRSNGVPQTLISAIAGSGETTTQIGGVNGLAGTSNVWTTVRASFNARGQTLGIGYCQIGSEVFALKALALSYKLLPPGRP